MADNQVTEQAILEALRQVKDPELKRDLVSLNMVRDVSINDGEVSLRIVLTTPACPLRGAIEADVQQALKAVPGVKSVKVEMDAEVRAFAGPRGRRRSRACATSSPSPATRAAWARRRWP